MIKEVKKNVHFYKLNNSRKYQFMVVEEKDVIEIWLFKKDYGLSQFCIGFVKKQANGNDCSMQDALDYIEDFGDEQIEMFEEEINRLERVEIDY